MKDFLYLDTDTISSISAQLFEGNIIETSSSESNTSAESTTDSRTNKTGDKTEAKASFKIAAFTRGKNDDFTDTIANRWDESSSAIQSTKKAFDDYLYNKVILELEEQQQLYQINDANQFDFVSINQEFSALDFNLTTNLFDTDLLKRLPSFNEDTFEMPDIKTIEKKVANLKSFINSNGSIKPPKDFKSPKDALEFYSTYQGLKVIDTLNEFALHLNKIFRDKIIFYSTNTILIGDKENLRIGSDLLALSDSIKLNGFGRIVSRTEDKKTIAEVTDVGDLINPNNFFVKGTQSLLFIFLNLLLGLEENSTFEIIQPIGLEFSKVPR